jgi:hypothetical protein
MRDDEFVAGIRGHGLDSQSVLAVSVERPPDFRIDIDSWEQSFESAGARPFEE